MTKTSNLDSFEMDMFRKGYKLISESELIEESDFSNQHKVFPNIKSLCNDVRFAGFHEEVLIRIKYKDNKYFAAIYVKD